MFGHSAVLVWDSAAERAISLEVAKLYGWGGDCFDYGAPGETGNYACTLHQLSGASVPLYKVLTLMFEPGFTHLALDGE